MSPAGRWLRERLPDSPPLLLEAMVAEVAAGSEPNSEDEGPESVAGALAAAAVRIYARLLEAGRGADRRDALSLLAADALLTHALEAQAEADPDGVAALAERIGAAGALATLAG